MDAALDAVGANDDLLDEAALAIREADLHRRTGRVVDLIGLIVEATGLEAEVGEVCTIETGRGRAVRARRGRRLPRRPHAADGARRGRGHRPGRARDRLRPAADGRRERRPARAARSTASVVRWTARARSRTTLWRPAEAAPPDPLSRPRIEDRVSLGVRALDAHGALRARPAPRHLRRLRRRQVVAAGHDRPLDLGRDQRHLPGRRARSRGARVHAARPRRRGPRALGRRLRDLRPARAGAPEGRVHRDRDRGVLPRPGPQRDADDGLGHALRHGPARGRPGDRRAARHARLHAVGVRDAPEAARALRHLALRLDHRALHRAGRRRRHERADRRRRPRHPRRPHRALAPPRARGPLPGDRRARLRLPPGRRDRHPRGPRRRQRGPQADGDLQGEGRPDLDRRLPARLRPADRRGHRGPRPDRRLPQAGRHRALLRRARRRHPGAARDPRRRLRGPARHARTGAMLPAEHMPLHNAIPPLHIPS